MPGHTVGPRGNAHANPKWPVYLTARVITAPFLRLLKEKPARTARRAAATIAAAGHEVASHGHEHVNRSQYDRAYIEQNISRTHAILVRLSGQKPRFFRPPNGDLDDLVVRTAGSLGCETVIWSVDSLDWKNPGADYMVERVTKLAFPGALVLFHASDSSRQVHEALPAVLKNLKARGYRLVTLGELHRRGELGRDDPRGNPNYPPVRDEDVAPPGGADAP